MGASLHEEITCCKHWIRKMRVRILIYVCLLALIVYGVTVGSHARHPVDPVIGIEKAFPIYPESDVVLSTELDFREGGQLILESQETPAQILTFYKRTMQEEGWTLRLEREDFLALFKKGRGLMIQTEGPLEGKTRVTLVAGALDA
jgi:hypothetical protein